MEERSIEMKNFLLLILCTIVISALCLGNTKASESYGQPSQAQDEVKNYDIYVGKYEVRQGFILTITNENNKLMGQPTGDAKIEFKADAEADMFSSSQENVQLKFVRDDKGDVDSVIVTFDGNSFPSKKIK